MNEEILHRVMQVAIYSGGIVAFWQITKHMPKALYTLLECIIVMTFSVLLLTPFSMIIEYILGGNIDNTMMFVGSLCGASFLSVLWMTLVALSREWQGKEQYKYRFL